jgi:copper resistance protein B
MIRLVSALAATSVLALAAPVAAQEMKGMNMSGMAMPMPAKKAPAKTSATKKVAPSRRPAVGRSAGHQTAHGSTTPEVPMPGMDMPGGHAGQDTASMPGVAQTGTALAPGNAPAPAPPMDHYADRMFSPIEMTRARSAMMHESGGQTTYQVIGGDINRLWLKSEGEGAFREGVDGAEVQALYSRAVGPYFNLQGGVRHDFRPSPTRNYATIGFEGLAPYMFEVEGALFLSTRGELLGRLEGYYDQRITQRLILQPRVEFNLSAQDVPENRIGAGLTDAELGLRLRYEITRQFAPYIGVSYLAQAGRTADFTRARGKDPQTTSFVAGVRFWF